MVPDASRLDRVWSSVSTNGCQDLRILLVVNRLNYFIRYFDHDFHLVAKSSSVINKYCLRQRIIFGMIIDLEPRSIVVLGYAPEAWSALSARRSLSSLKARNVTERISTERTCGDANYNKDGFMRICVSLSTKKQR